MKQVTLTLYFPDTFSNASIENTICDIENDLPNVNGKYPSVDRSTIFDAIRAWAHAKGIYEKGDPKTQTLKLGEEFGELSKAVLNNDLPEIQDAIGDCVVVLVSVAKLCGLNIEDCIASAYDVIKNRKGKMENGTFIKQ